MKRLKRANEWATENYIATRLAPLAIPTFALVFSQIAPELGRSVDIDFYNVIATVIPVLVIAFLVKDSEQRRTVRERFRAMEVEWWEARKVEPKDRLVRRAREIHEAKERMDKLLKLGLAFPRSSMFLACEGEALALIAVATQESTTFLLFACVGILTLLALFALESHVDTPQP